MGPMHHLPELSGLLSPALHYSAGAVLPVSPLRSLLPSQDPRPCHAPQCQPWSPATKLGDTVALLEIRKRSGRMLLSARRDERFSLPPLIRPLLLFYHQ